MDQPSLNFTAAPAYQRRSHSSWDGARVATVKASSQKARILRRYLHVGAQTDLEMAAALGLPESRISARRSSLVQSELVQFMAYTQGPHGAKNGQWILTAKGAAIAQHLTRAAEE